jgi:ribonuclease HI
MNDNDFVILNGLHGHARPSPLCPVSEYVCPIHPREADNQHRSTTPATEYHACQCQIAQFSRIGVDTSNNRVVRSLLDYIALPSQYLHLFAASDSVQVVNDDGMDLMSDHRPVWVQLSLPTTPQAELGLAAGIKRGSRKRRRRERKQCKTETARQQAAINLARFNTDDNNDPQYWTSLQQQLDLLLPSWISAVEPYIGMRVDTNELDLESIYQSFASLMHLAMIRSIGRKRAFKRNGVVAENKSYVRWEKEIADLKRRKQAMVLRMVQAKRAEDQAVVDTSTLEIHRLKNRIRSVTRRKSRSQFAATIAEIESIRTSSPRQFWDKLKKLVDWSRSQSRIPDNMRDQHGNLVSGEQVLYLWMQQFMAVGLQNLEDENFDKQFAAQVCDSVKLHREQQECMEPDQSPDGSSTECLGATECLNQDIEVNEVHTAIQKLKRCKASGADSIPNEALKYGGPTLTKAILVLCRLSFRCKRVTDSWRFGMIAPIPKPGQPDHLDPNSYRPITLLSCVGKIYGMILQTRLMQFCESQNILSEEQNGFRPDRSCTDNIYSLVELLQTRSAMHMKTVLCFVDLKKAYDVVFRDGLWKRLLDVGIIGRMWEILVNIYRDTRSAVFVNGQLSDSFEVQRGVRQGCVLSPLLFAIFIDGLVSEIRATNAGICIDSFTLSLLLYADDIVLTADNAVNIQRMLDVLHRYSMQWRFVINTQPDKTAVMFFNGVKHDNDTTFVLGQQPIAVVQQYTYLGVEITSPLSWHMLREKLLTRARRNMYRAWAMGTRAGLLTVRTNTQIYTALVRCHLEYAAEVCGCTIDKAWTSAELIQLRMGKLILHCPTHTSDEAVIGELGWWPIMERHSMLRLRWWARLITMKESRWPYIIYQYARNAYINSLGVGKREVHNWCSDTHKIMERIGLLDEWTEDRLITPATGVLSSAAMIRSVYYHSSTARRDWAGRCAVLLCDGACRGNPNGAAAIGGVILAVDAEGKNASAPHVCFASCLTGSQCCTNNGAEYHSLLYGVQLAIALGVTNLTVYMDSQVVVKQVSGEYSVNRAHLKQLNTAVHKLAAGLESFSIGHIQRKKNTVADALANYALNCGLNRGVGPYTANSRCIVKTGAVEVLIAAAKLTSKTVWPQTAPKPYRQKAAPDSACSRTDWFPKLHAIMQSFVEERWRLAMCTKDKLRTYRMIKTKWGCERYLEYDSALIGRQVGARLVHAAYWLTMLRTGTNPLAIEAGRHRGTPMERRVCAFCKAHNLFVTENDVRMFNLECNKKRVGAGDYASFGDANVYLSVAGDAPIEDEFHFLLDCPAYRAGRERLFHEILSISQLRVDPFATAVRAQKLALMLADFEAFPSESVQCKRMIIDRIKVFIYEAMETRALFFREGPRAGQVDVPVADASAESEASRSPRQADPLPLHFDSQPDADVYPFEGECELQLGSGPVSESSMAPGWA